MIRRKVIPGMMFLLYMVSPAMAQDPAAKKILAEVSRIYRTYDVIKTDFSYTVENPQEKTKQTEAGTLYVKSKTNKYKVQLKEQEMVSDGKTRWTYLKEDKEIQIGEADNTDAMNPARIFIIYETGFKYVYSGETKSNGRVYQTVDLTPVDTKRSYFKIRLSIDKVLKQVRGATIFDKNGNKYTYAIKTFTPNVKVPESTFTFDVKKYPGVEVVDLR
ncbi:LolA family protein [Hufsiella ginkgonis]|uniref:Outer membrane lipoprotein carrier protein LolA n=1 Tax=Hufsiella ginkgonis TaxID=2695274 RepID=A0A7K1XZ53_9SPHI|nr:outer membrane lipoprotein carrier protein LolA [Hufsiella ginkgonis]MXV16233.1 outer membrane lipoprotein carrier protein LolA [Hufsiella ginkgonis]